MKSAKRDPNKAYSANLTLTSDNSHDGYYFPSFPILLISLTKFFSISKEYGSGSSRGKAVERKGNQISRTEVGRRFRDEDILFRRFGSAEVFGSRRNHREEDKYPWKL